MLRGFVELNQFVVQKSLFCCTTKPAKFIGQVMIIALGSSAVGAAATTSVLFKKWWVNIFTCFLFQFLVCLMSGGAAAMSYLPDMRPPLMNAAHAVVCMVRFSRDRD